MRKYSAYIYITGAVFVFYLLVTLLSPKSIDWKVSLEPKDKKPYGTYVLKESLNDLFPDSKISENRRNFYYLNDNEKYVDAPKTVIIINVKSRLDKYSIEELLTFVENGNEVFYSSNYINRNLLDTLNIVEYSKHIDYNALEYIPLSINNIEYRDEDSVHFKYSHYMYFDNLDSLKFNYEIIGNVGDNWNNYVNFVRIDIGSGHLYLHSSPLAFTNFNILKNYTKGYTEDVFSMLQNREVIWDYSMSKNVVKDTSMFKVLFKYKYIKYAYFLFIMLIITYVASNFIRKQRLIPIVEPPKNSSMELVDSISELYVHQADHKNLSEKIIRHFADFISQKYNISTGQFDDYFVEKLYKKSHRSISEIKDLIGIIKRVQSQNTLGYEDVLELHQRIEDFKTPENK